jgi:hypothetical protein
VIKPKPTAKYTETDRSLLLTMLIRPVMNAAMPAVAAVRAGTVRIGLLKNVAPPRCPDATRIPNDPRDTAKVKISQADLLPQAVTGLK